MAKGGAAAAASTPNTATPGLKKSNSSTQNVKNQKTLHGFFQKTPSTGATPRILPERSSPRRNGSLQSKMLGRTSSSTLTPAPSSDGPEEQENIPIQTEVKSSSPRKGLPSPVSSANDDLEGQTVGAVEELTSFGTPSRKVQAYR